MHLLSGNNYKFLKFSLYILCGEREEKAGIKK